MLYDDPTQAVSTSIRISCSQKAGVGRILDFHQNDQQLIIRMESSVACVSADSALLRSNFSECREFD